MSKSESGLLLYHLSVKDSAHLCLSAEKRRKLGDLVQILDASALLAPAVSTVHATHIKSTLSNSDSLEHRENVRITKNSNHGDSNYEGSLFGDFQGTLKSYSN